MKKVTEQYGDVTGLSGTEVVRLADSAAALPKNLTDLPARVMMLENRVASDHDSITQLRRDLSRMKDHIVSLEQHLYNLRNAIR